MAIADSSVVVKVPYVNGNKDRFFSGARPPLQREALCRGTRGITVNPGIQMQILISLQ